MTDGHVEQGVDVVAQARVGDAPGADRPDEDAPVGRDERGRQQHRPPPLRIAQMTERLAPTTRHQEQRHHEEERPHDPVRQDLERRDAVEELPVDREETPEDVGQRAHEGATSRSRVGRARGSHGRHDRVLLPRARRTLNRDSATHCSADIALASRLPPEPRA